MLHWNGSRWTRLTSPKVLAGAGQLSAISVVSANIGQSAIQTQPLIFKLTGTKVTRSDPKFGAGSGVALDGVATTSTTTFATGLFTGMITGELARWNGTSWSFVKSFPQQGTFHWLNAIAAGPHGIAFAPGGTGAAWSAGYRDTGGKLHSLILRWTGHAWNTIASPSTGGQLFGLGFATANYGWAVGNANPDSPQPKTQILHWNGHTWH